MTITSELSPLRRAVAEARAGVASIQERYGDIPAVRRLIGDIDRLAVDMTELEELNPPPRPSPDVASEPAYIDDTPPDPALWADADDEGVGGVGGVGGAPGTPHRHRTGGGR